ncbi:MAG: preprotein translocase subunit SecE, partial [Lachnospiraceae bacterium]|nr:preprotein translocase subunit SecE [Lachnospiraceae bacterium]
MADSAEKTKKQSFFKNVQIEFKKISWPDRKTM